MKTTVLLGMIALMSIVAYSNVGSAPRAISQGPDRPVAMAALADAGGSGGLSARISEYLFLHQARDENLPVHAMAGVKACTE